MAVENLSQVVKTLPCLGSKACQAVCAHFALLWIGHIAQAPAMSINMEHPLRTFVRHFDDLRNGRGRGYVIWSATEHEPQKLTHAPLALAQLCKVNLTLPEKGV